jgi:hypothetical protein
VFPLPEEGKRSGFRNVVLYQTLDERQNLKKEGYVSNHSRICLKYLSKPSRGTSMVVGSGEAFVLGN